MTTDRRFNPEKKGLGGSTSASLRSQIDILAEDVYEHFLRESCNLVIDGEWYRMALAVADRFEALILDSQQRDLALTMSTLATMLEDSDGSPLLLQQ